MYFYNPHIPYFGYSSSCNAYLPNQHQPQRHQQQQDADWNTKTNNWKDKSDAAKSRELHAKSIFDHQFLPQAKKSTTTFPFTMNDIIPPEIHLTNLCYRDFRKYVISQGCSVSRRVITEEEKAALKSADRKRVKMYSLSITARDHPDVILKKEEEFKVAKERLDARIQAQREDERMDALVSRDYNLIESHLLQSWSTGTVMCTSSSDKEASIMDANSTTNKKRPLGDRTNDASVSSASSPSPFSSSPSKKVRLSKKSHTTIKVTAPTKRLLMKADQCHRNKIIEIETKIAHIKHKKMKELEVQLKGKEERKLQEALMYHEAMKKMIQQVANATATAEGSSPELGKSVVPSSSTLSSANSEIANTK